MARHVIQWEATRAGRASDRSSLRPMAETARELPARGCLPRVALIRFGPHMLLHAWEGSSVALPVPRWAAPQEASR